MINQSLILSLFLLWLIVIPKVTNGQGFDGFSDDVYDKKPDNNDDKKSDDHDEYPDFFEKYKSLKFDEDEFSDKIEEKYDEELEKFEEKLDKFKEPIFHNNFILIIGDDLGIELLRMYRQDLLGQGRDNYPDTRVLDDLVANGVRFTQAHSNPTCSPTRVTILTGRYAFRSMLTYPIGANFCEEGLDYPQPTIPLSLPKNVRSAVFGKWHLSPETNGPSIQHVFDAGFEYYDGLLFGQISNGGPMGYVNWERCNNENPNCFNEEGYFTRVITDAAIEWLKEFQREQFFLWVAHVAPRPPAHIPPLDLITNALPVDCTLDLPPEEAVFCALAALEAMDKEIGRLLDSLDEDVRKKTTILFLGDNGTAREFADSKPFTPENAKGSVFEGGIRVPFFISGNGVTAKGGTSNALVTTADVYATVLDIMGGSPNLNVKFDSKSLVPFMKSSRYNNHHDYIFSEIKGIPSRCLTPDLFELFFDSSDAIIGYGYKLITFISYADNDEEVIEEERFFNLDEDPFENNDLLADGEGALFGKELEILNNLREKRLELLNS